MHLPTTPDRQTSDLTLAVRPTPIIISYPPEDRKEERRQILSLFLSIIILTIHHIISGRSPFMIGGSSLSSDSHDRAKEDADGSDGTAIGERVVASGHCPVPFHACLVVLPASHHARRGRDDPVLHSFVLHACLSELLDWIGFVNFLSPIGRSHCDFSVSAFLDAAALPFFLGGGGGGGGGRIFLPSPRPSSLFFDRTFPVLCLEGRP
ncbi:hypothetical protein BDA96_10G341700 [Sorghum bicolor]|uniref:Uncharacterized protein n=1 Tax=Sorghum bicolor TaxID=4558 RepID=A0A921Q8H6_SORBI|nr:hypothetical protein BDA96_10G341700 [Sorghum bicolor]